ncbi:MAG: iron-sulfur cluster-binding protein [Desulfohalobiaceae bacterium]
MNHQGSLLPGKGLRSFFVILFAVLAFTGVGQMPIFKRYYITDIPGLGWSGDFYLTHTIHYLGAFLLLALAAYMITLYILALRSSYRLSLPGLVRSLFLVALVLTGIMRALKNLPQVTFSPSLTMFIDISHLGFMFLFLLAAAAFKLTGLGWLKTRT